MLAQDLNAAEAPAEALALEGGEGERHDALTEGPVQVQAGVAGLQQTEGRLGVLGDAPLVPSAKPIEGRAPDQAHRPGEDDRVALVA